MKGLLSASVKVRCESKSGTPVWVLENGRPVPDCLKPCANKTEHPAATRSGHQLEFLMFGFSKKLKIIDLP